MSNFFTRWSARIDQRASLMERMAAHQGVDLSRATEEALGTSVICLFTTCRGCPSTDRCRNWLDAGCRDDAWRTFCPNSDAFSRLAAQQGRHGPN